MKWKDSGLAMEEKPTTILSEVKRSMNRENYTGGAKRCDERHSKSIQRAPRVSVSPQLQPRTIVKIQSRRR